MLVAKKRQPELSFYDHQRKTKKIAAQRENNLQTAAVKLKMFAVLLSFMLIAILLVAHYTYVVHISYEIDSGVRELKALQDETQHLKLELASLQSPERLEKMALEIGMQHPDRDQFVILTAGVSGN
ncbi:MAG: cell division protein FtsL [Bacillota bacterium]|nr:cell division protein FtsL [Bacillota bacterium]MDW7684023.1 cell division protein FtsL [Bacillota bacterium]